MDSQTEISENKIDSAYECPICQCVLTQPYEIAVCKHIFCKKCIESTVHFNKNKKFQCPLCKATFSKRELKADEKLEDEINTKTIVCTCKKTLTLNEWNDHTSSCQEYLGGVDDNIKKTVVKDAKQTVNRSTFTCPCCAEKNLDREALIKHVKSKHKNEQAVCPICVCQPWGDPNYVTHLLGHLNKRHKFDYDTIVDYNNEEDEILNMVLMESIKYK